MRHVCVAAALVLGFATPGLAQSASELGAWDALMLSPFGALPPRIGSGNPSNERRNEILLRYGRWRYDIDDAPHNTFGLTLARELPLAHVEMALTGAYLSLQCGGCSNWVIGGLELQSTLWRRTFSHSSRSPVTAWAGVQSSIGGARNAGTEKSHAGSAAVATVLGLGFPVGKHSYVDAAVIPGFGYGRIVGVSRIDAGTRPSIGGAAVWRWTSGFGIELGVQKIVIHRGPAQLGVGLSWGLGARRTGPS